MARYRDRKRSARKAKRAKPSRLRFETLEDRRLLAVVINEIHYNSDENTSFEEFIELHNTAATPVDLSGWEFTDGIDYTFEPGAQIPAGGYVVVAQDPATLLAEFGVVAIGQYEGGLSNGGERIAISDAGGQLIDEVEYTTSFPWPVAADGEGPSMELINPALDNNLGSNWRPTYADPLFAVEDDDPPTDPGGAGGLVHRWSFSGNLEDSVGGADGVLVDPTGLSSYFDGQLNVSSNSGQNSNQTPFGSGAYVDLPNGIVSSLGENATFEWWGTVTRNRTWAEIWSFGTSGGGEDQATGANNQGYVTLIPESGSGDLRLTHRNGGTSSESVVDWNQAASTNREYHFTVVWDGASGVQTLYVDGAAIGSSATIIDLDDLNDNNNWLGRSQWPDPLFDGYHNEFRIYNQALTSGQVAASYAAGPDAVFAGPNIESFEASSDAILAGEPLRLRWDVTDATTLSISPDVGDVTGQTSVWVTPTETTTYTLTAVNGDGATTRSLQVVVEARRATPGAANANLAANAAPAIASVDHAGGDASTSAGVVTAEVSDPDGVASVELQYQIVLPGQYIPARLPVPHNDLLADPEQQLKANPDYLDEANWATVTMVDDGTGADQTAGDGVYSASIPAQAHRTLVRYRVAVEDTLGAAAVAPYADDPSLNFAYFVYDGLPEYLNNSGQVVADAEALASLPVYHLLTRAEDMQEAIAYDPADQIPQGTEARSAYNWGGTIVYNGEVYDNIQYRPRGANGRYYGEGKRSMRFRFNDGAWFEPLDQDGEPYPEQWKTLTTGKGFDNHQTLTYALNEAITMQLSNMMGLPALDTHWFQFRVIDDAAEAPNQWDGDFWGVNFALEDYDKRFLDAHGLEEGNLYKLNNQTQDALRQLDYQAPYAVSDGSDHDYVEYVMGRASDDLEHRVNLEQYFVYHAIAEAVRHYDYWPTANKNAAYYFEPDYAAENDNLGKLWLLLWDTDASWGPSWNEGEDIVYEALFDNFDSAYADSLLKPGYYNTLRELRDLIWQPDQIEGMIRELAATIQPLEAADRARWQGAPDDAGNYDGLTGPGAVSIEALIGNMLDFAFVGGNWPHGGSGTGFVGPGGRAAYLDNVLAASGEEALVPFTPSLSYVGDPGMAANELTFQTTAFNDPQGAGTFGAVQWRVSQVTPVSAGADPSTAFLDEWTSSWDSGALTEFNATTDVPASAVTPGETYRARVRMQDDTGRWSHWSDPVEFVAAAPTDPPSLAITELHYHPLNPSLVDEDDQEFLEILNTGDVTVDLSGMQIADFASTPYVFADGLTLAPGEYIVVARNTEVFQQVYGEEIYLAPTGYADSNLSNGGETVSLLGPTGQVIHSVTYTDDPPWPTTPDGDGPSLEIIDPLGDPNDPANWRASLYVMGSPGSAGLAIPGDYDASGVVDQADYQAWRSAYGTGVEAPGYGADGNRDGVVDAADYSVWRDHLGDNTTLYGSLAPAPAPAAPAPEATQAAPTVAATESTDADEGIDPLQAAFALLTPPDSSDDQPEPLADAAAAAAVDDGLLLLYEGPAAAASEEEEVSVATADGSSGEEPSESASASVQRTVASDRV
ncbi:CotH protein [Posidoniimonas corsicana]|uniref:CotH protein n=1 Tax=Posidoniimonas corsicana TaxID=1938618 RepID=A0A5C5UXE0_9BACT|nr:lamin tail domain-containing protein [Posidoniimonas corsicana]TWT30469.1 CotH protein [Posidoniimonas corsicana]